MIRHDSSEQNEENGPGTGTPGLRALGAMAAAAAHAREAQDGGPPTQAVEIRFDDEAAPPPAAPPPPGSRDSRRPPSRRSPLEMAVWVVAALVLVAAGALAVTVGTADNSGSPTALPTTTVPSGHHLATHVSSRHRGSGVITSPATSTTTTTLAAGASGPPVIAALNPASGTSGQAIQVAGAKFLSSSGQIVATFDGQVAPTSCPAPTTCSVTVPPPPSGSHTAQVVITTPTGTSNTVTFTYS